MTELAPLVSWLHALRLEDVPDDVRASAAESFANMAGVAIGGVGDDAPQRALVVTAALGSTPQVHVIGTGQMRNIEHAALVDGIAAHVLDFDDTDLATIYHAGSVLYGSVWPVAEWLDADGRDVMAAWIVGLETGIRVARALGMPHYDRGWHVTGTAGSVAAAAATGRLMGLDADAFAAALNIGATMAGGHRTQFGSDTKSGHVGFAARSGVLAALLAREGFTVSPLGLTGSRGLLGVVGPDGTHDALTASVRTHWCLLDDRIKPYASGVVTHPAIDAAREVASACGRDPLAYGSITLRVHPLVTELTGIPVPATGLQGKFSVRHCFAVGFLNDKAAAAEFTDTAVRSPSVAAVRDLVDVVPDEAMPHMTVTAYVRLVDGSVREFPVTRARGSDARPMTSDEVRAKFVDLVSPRTGAEGAEAWYDRLSAMTTEPSAAEVARSLDADTCT